MTSRAGQLLKRGLRPFIVRAGEAFLFGETAAEALALASRLDSSGIPATLAYWDGPSDTPATIEAEQQACIAALARLATPARMAIKAPALNFGAPAIRRLAATARDARVGLVFDAHAPEDADRTLALARDAVHVGATTVVAIPARWARSEHDARAALLDGIHVRIVKGQWADPDPSTPGTERQLRASFIDLSNCLRPQASLVNVATHDARLVEALLKTGDSTRPFAELELLMGLPASRVLHRARQHDVPTRWYVPYGYPSIGFDLGELMRRPRLASTVARAVARGHGNRTARERELGA